jgi:hypothetical protein
MQLGATEYSERARGTQERTASKRLRGFESGLIPYLFISCLKPIPKLVLVLTEDPYICILLTSNRGIGERAVATGVITPEVCEGLNV